ncbi:MAG: nitric oxide synthase, partial [Devosia sp.]|uniref:PepSY domain-containing protein n=1 Tax=Devosia sp. TaxID=1871048 RepID=UPI00260A2B4B
SGSTIVYSHANGAASADLVNPATGASLGAYEPSAFFSFFTELHRSLFLGPAGQAVAGCCALAMAVLALSGILMLVSRLGGWSKLLAVARGTLRQRLHVDIGRLAVLGLLLSALTGIYMSLVSFGFISDGSDGLGAFPPLGSGAAPAAISELAALKSVPLADLRELVFPSPSDQEDVFTVTTAAGQGFVDQSTGEMLSFTPNSLGQTIYEAFYTLHTGQGLWWLGLLLGLAALGVPVMAVSGALVWWNRSRGRPRIAGNVAPHRADTIILVGSESNATWGFAAELHQQLNAAGAKVHTNAMNSVGRNYAHALRMFILTSTYGNGTAPASANRFLARVRKWQEPPAYDYAVLGFGDHSFQHFSAFAEDVDDELAELGWHPFQPLASIDRQSSQSFAQWGLSTGQNIGAPLDLNHVPVQPRTMPLELVGRVDYGTEIQAPTSVLRFAAPEGRSPSGLFGWARRELPKFEPGDLVGIVPPGSTIPRYYSLASGSGDGFIEICVRKQQGGLCSEFLFGLEAGDGVDAFIRSNPDFRPAAGRRPVVMIGNGTGIAPFMGFIWNNKRRRPMHLYWGGRNPEADFLYEDILASCVEDHRLTSHVTAFSRAAERQYVQDRLWQDPATIQMLCAAGAQFLICGSQEMATGVAEAIGQIISPLGDSIDQLKAKGRYLEDVY